MGRRAAKDERNDPFAAAAKALGNRRHAEIMDWPAQGECPVEALAGEIGQSVESASVTVAYRSHHGEALRVGTMGDYDGAAPPPPAG